MNKRNQYLGATKAAIATRSRNFQAAARLTGKNTVRIATEAAKRLPIRTAAPRRHC